MATQIMAETTQAIDDVYQARKLRLIHPVGQFDNAGRWYPSPAEDAGVSGTVRWPSRAWPYSLMVACRTRKHVAALATTSPDLFTAEVSRARAALARTSN